MERCSLSSPNILHHLFFFQILACVNVHPLISSAVEAAKEDLYEVLEEVNCPTMMLTCRDNCPNEKPGGLASNVYKWVNNFDIFIYPLFFCSASPFGKNCIFEELNLHHGFLVEVIKRSMLLPLATCRGIAALNQLPLRPVSP